MRQRVDSGQAHGEVWVICECQSDPGRLDKKEEIIRVRQSSGFSPGGIHCGLKDLSGHWYFVERSASSAHS